MTFSLQGLLPWLFALMLPGPNAEAVFSSREITDIFYPIWSTWHRADDYWIFMLPGDKRENKGIAVYRWDTGKKPQWLQSTSVREGIYKVRTSALSPSGKQLLIRSYRNPVLFAFNIDQPDRFKRAYHLELSDAILFWDENTVLSGSKFPKLRFKTYGDDASPIPQLKSLKRQLPDKINHPVEPYYVKNIMHLSKDGQRLAVAFGLTEEVTIWDGQRRQRHIIGFPGYVKPPWRRPKNLNKLKDWYQGFHHLQTLTWFRGELYAMFQHGYDDLGVWVKFQGYAAKKIWDNNQAPIRIFAMEKDGLILGEKIMDTEEEVQWRLWQASSLPSR